MTRSSASRACCASSFAAVLFCGAVALAQGPKAPPKPPAAPRLGPPSPLDQELLGDLAPVQPKPANPAVGKARPPASAGEDLGAAPENPLVKIGQALAAAGEKLAPGETLPVAAKLQAGAVADLEALLAQLKKQQPGGGKSPSGGNKSSSGQAGTEAGAAGLRPGLDSTQRLEQGQAEQVEVADVREALRRIWGHLPEKEREQMLSTLGEKFLPKYEKLIESFYRKLAAEPAPAP